LVAFDPVSHGGTSFWGRRKDSEEDSGLGTMAKKPVSGPVSQP